MALRVQFGRERRVGAISPKGIAIQMRRVAILGAAALTFLQAAAQPVLEVRVKGDVVLNQPVVLWQQVRNSSKAPLELNLGYDRIGHWNFSLRRPDGSVHRAMPTSFVVGARNW